MRVGGQTFPSKRAYESFQGSCTHTVLLDRAVFCATVTLDHRRTSRTAGTESQRREKRKERREESASPKDGQENFLVSFFFGLWSRLHPAYEYSRRRGETKVQIKDTCRTMDEYSRKGVHVDAQRHPVLSWALEHKLKTIGYVWLGGITGSLAYNWTRPISTSLKLIHSRVYAQAITLGALGALASIEMYAQGLERKEGGEV